MNVGLALRSSSKGQIRYDKFWVEDGRTKEVLDEISLYSTKVSLNISPKVLSAITKDCNQAESYDESDSKKEISSTPPAPSIPKPVNGITESYFYEVQSEKEIPLLEYEEERWKYLQEIFNSKKHEFDKHSFELQERKKQEYLMLKRNSELDTKKRLGDLQKLELALLNEAKEKEMLKKEQHKSHVKKLSAKVQEAEIKQKRAEEEIRKRQQEQSEFKTQLESCLLEAQILIAKSLEKLSIFDYPDHLRVPFNDRVDQMAKTVQPINDLVERSKTAELNIEDVLNANLCVKAAYEAFQDIVNDIESAKVKAAQVKAATVSVKEIVQPPSIVTSADTFDSASTEINTQKSQKLSAEIKKDENRLTDVIEKSEAQKQKEAEKKLLQQFIAPDAVDHHHMIMENLKRVKNVIQPIVTDSRNKRYRFELQKAINVPINSLSSNSGSQIKTKVNRLLTILSGKIPEINGKDMSSDSVVYNFCINLIAKQFVEQADTQISAQYSTAFPIAMAILGVWNKKPDVGLLILGYFYTRCPYLVPFYPPQQGGQSDEDYFRSLGYEYDDEGNMEPKYKFLNRVSGFVRLYAAIIVSPLPPNVKSPHPHGISWAWKWLSRALNLDPRPDVTATVLYNFLEVTGHSLQKTYGKQFRKMLHILCKDYFPKIKLVTPVGSGGPVERLETFLQQAVKKGSIPPPEGFLEPSFWVR